jgi:hypothetical protein
MICCRRSPRRWRRTHPPKPMRLVMRSPYDCGPMAEREKTAAVNWRSEPGQAEPPDREVRNGAHPDY